MNVLQCLDETDFALITNHESEESTDCMICLEPVNGLSVYRYKYWGDRSFHKPFIFHKSCGELPGNITHPLHPHPLKISDFYAEETGLKDFTCDVCFAPSVTYKYRCRTCDKKVCYPCISKYVEGQERRQKVEIFTPYHSHMLQLVNLSYVGPATCLCCLKSVGDSCYVCLRCEEFYSHVSCISDVPEEVKSSFHPEHPLIVKQIPSETTLKCTACPKEIEQVQLGCGICNCSFHVSCGQYISPGLRVNGGDVTLFYVNDYFDDVDYCCDVCDGKILQAPTYRLLGSIKNFHVECVLPPIVDHPCHHHSLALSRSVERKTEARKYCCDVCEEEEDFERHAYRCVECYFNAHMECLFTEEDKSLKIELFQPYDKAEDISAKDEVALFNVGQDIKYEEYSFRDDDRENEDVGEEEEKSDSEDHREDEDIGKEEKKFDLENLSPVELREKISSVSENIKQLHEEIEKLTAELNLLKLMYDKRNQESET